MHKEILKGDWNVIKGKIKEKWGKFTDDDLTEIEGKKDQLLGKLQKRYGLAKDKAEEEFAAWEKMYTTEEHHRTQTAKSVPTPHAKETHKH